MSLAERTRWDARYRGAASSFAPSAFLAELDALLPRSGRGLDLTTKPGATTIATKRASSRVDARPIASSRGPARRG